MLPSQPQLVSIQIGVVAALKIHRGKNDEATITSGIRKQSVSTPTPPTRITVNKLGLAGDEQSDLTVHGGLEKAIYAYPAEHYAFWQIQLGRQTPLMSGVFGENLTTIGLLESMLWIGDELHFSDCILSVASPRRPCYKLNAVLESDAAATTMMKKQFTGWYMSVVKTGSIFAGETIQVVPGPRRVSLTDRQRQMTRPSDLY